MNKLTPRLSLCTINPRRETYAGIFLVGAFFSAGEIAGLHWGMAAIMTGWFS